ncbi:class I SAM-dependent methyltransferase [Vibrio sp. PP-XX7]
MVRCYDRLYEFQGYNYIGCDYSKEAFELYKKNYGKNITKYQEKLSNINLKDIELIVSFDVFEHMTDEQIESFFIETREVDTYLLNISRQNGIPGHINLKDDSQWKSFFEKNGLQIDLDKTNLARETYLDISYNPQDGWDKNIFVVVRSQ